MSIGVNGIQGAPLAAGKLPGGARLHVLDRNSFRTGVRLAYRCSRLLLAAARGCDALGSLAKVIRRGIVGGIGNELAE
jgi:hypothetical protein